MYYQQNHSRLLEPKPAIADYHRTHRGQTACRPISRVQRSDLVFLVQVSRLDVFIQSARFELTDPDSYQLTRDVVSLRQARQRFS